MKARESERIEAVKYRKYVTDSLFYSAQNQRLTLRYADMLKPQVEQETRDGDEIAADIIARHGLKVMKGGKQK